MEHRPLPHHSSAIRRYLNEPACLYGRLWAANGSDREKFYVDAHKPQLRTVQQDISRREPSQANRFPFLCVFHFAGCDQKFENKRDWKDHVVSQHLKPERVFWECNESLCAHIKRTRWQQRLFLQVKDIKTLRFQDYNGTLLANIHDFRTHLVECHRSTKSHDKKRDIAFRPDTEGQWLVDRQDSAMRMVCGLPQDLGCPMPQCASVRFTGPTAWDQRLNHAAEHFLVSPQCLGVFGGEKDAELVQWASSDDVAIYQKAPNACFQQHDCGKSVADSGYSSMPGMPRHPNPSQQGDSSPVVPSKMPRGASDAAFDDHSTEELYLSAGSLGIGGWVRDHGYIYMEPVIDEESSSSAYQSFQELLSQYESIEADSTLNTSQDSDSSDESDGTTDGNPETAAVMQWFHGWLRQWLSPLTQGRPSGNGSSQATASQSQTSSSSSTQKKGTGRPRRVPKRKRGNDGEDDGNEESPKSQRVDGGQQTRMLACPYFKRNPRKYGRPEWKSCAHPGYRDLHRVKEHMYRRHSLPEYQCRRCRVDLKTSEALEAHSQQLQACTPTVGNQDGLNQEQVKRMRSKKGTGKNKSEGDRWNDVYSIAFPYDQHTPSPYLYDTDEDKSAREFNLCHEFGGFLTRELPPLVGRHLSTVGYPLPESIRDDIEQLVRRFVPQLQTSFLKEMSFVASTGNEQPDSASATNDAASFVESTTTRRTSEDSATTLQRDNTHEDSVTILPRGSTSEASMSMFPTSNGSQELTTMPQINYVGADSTMLQNGTFSGQGMMIPASQTMPPYFSPTIEDWQVIYQQLGYDPNLALGFGGMKTS
ncbi:hypothetical protein FoTM2_004981 [Fusarium oxysporum f. sp. vasinfectum]|uniref:C2H2-type domain-containing protein n=1 Tax=Fusarium oxysporum f. sp. vasinfectum 25433 TaxID=1089449 RepID=X0LH98_FUSOX|nr:hypothetical protein FOTG_11763 [Fusarium oxysporum f. sp. vasinfectum 25433]KAK2933737.1 hypothetical protein FoTM2_004981 [Fusarium oxysporum f. sp. vasinfectum]